MANTANRVHGAVSDLFFNTYHDNYDALYASKTDDEEITDEEIFDSLKDDAEDFLNCLVSLGVEGATVEDLIADFMARV